MLKRIVCFFRGHRTRVIQTFGPQGSQRVRCTRCHRDFVINHVERAVIPWTREVEDMYRMFGNDIIEPFF